MIEYALKISEELSIRTRQTEAVLELLGAGGTVPFIARYRKEATGSLDETQITAIRDRLVQLQELDKRRKTILETIEKSGKFTDELKEKILAAETMAVLEDLYLPYKPKRRTRATIAREKGLEGLAEAIFAQGDFDPQVKANKFINNEKGVETAEDALGGARDIIAEWISENEDVRSELREIYSRSGVMETKVISGKEEEGAKYKDYFDWQETAQAAPSHRVLAMRRGENEGYLRLRIAVPDDYVIDQIESMMIKHHNAASEQVKLAIADGYKRLLSLSMATEVRLENKKRADEEAIRVFADNLRQLLLAAALGQKNVMAVDPGFRTGCKTVCLDQQGKLLANDTIYPHSGERGQKESGQTLKRLSSEYEVECIAVGNGTAGRETEAFIRQTDLGREIPVVMVNESGASIYSASEAAREEFPDYDLTVRGAVSIGRRLMDPLAELVKLDPKSIGVGQYQHDVDQIKLKNSLDDTVISCVNAVGVEVNTASKQLLMYVSGLGPQLAENIVAYRNENGPFASRAELKKVPKLGAKTFEQCGGFLRIRGGKNPLDASAVHPESYATVKAMSKNTDCSVGELMTDKQLRDKIRLQDYVTETVGLPTLSDILAELAKPGRDPREQFTPFQFAEHINKMEDLSEGMKLPGIVTNITAFGAFVDIGVHQDGLVHISQMANRFIKDPGEVVKVHQKIEVTVMEVDITRKRISLSMKN
ncbi:MAG: RNA-binding transcriptional accessory protein [Planctomycetes bacterium]|nr:RNA-binding transcriptional accessory protein [Planctomycetota bacterium]